MGKVTSGQITIIDQNDAKSVTSFLSPSVIQQTYTPSEGTNAVRPNWQVEPQSIDANVFVTGTDGNIINTEYFLDFAWTIDFPYDDEWTAVEKQRYILYAKGSYSSGFTGSTIYYVDSDNNGKTINISRNILNQNVKTKTIYFQGKYIDPATELVTSTICSAALNFVIEGSSPTYIQLSGNTTIKISNTIFPEYAVVTAKLITLGTDVTHDTSCVYRWSQESLETPGVFVPLFQNNNQLSTHFKRRTMVGANGGIKDIYLDFNDTPSENYVPKYITFWGDESGVSDQVYVENQFKGRTPNGDVPMTIKIHEDAVDEMARFKVEIFDISEGGEFDSNNLSNYPCFSYIFTVNDISDPIGVDIYSDGGDKFRNGQGTTTLIPYIKNGTTGTFPDKFYEGFYFIWYILDNNGKKAAFVDMNGNNPRVSLDISSNNATTITVSGAITGIQQDDIIKLLASTKTDVVYCKVKSISGSTITIDTDSNTGYTTSLVANKYGGGFLYKCFTGDTNASPYSDINCKDSTSIVKLATNEGASSAKITVTQYDIDIKGTIAVDVFAPPICKEPTPTT